MLALGRAPRNRLKQDDHALGDKALVKVAGKPNAAHRTATDKFPQRAGGVLPAPPAFSIPAAKLLALRGVNAVKPDTLAVDFQRVAVDHAGLTGDVGPGERGEQEQRQGEGDRAIGHGPGIVAPSVAKKKPHRSGARRNILGNRRGNMG